MLSYPGIPFHMMSVFTVLPPIPEDNVVEIDQTPVQMELFSLFHELWYLVNSL